MDSKVFISSTCYDLIDLRAELEIHLKSMGLTPIFSDRPLSEFEVKPDRNSIENCLLNIRKSEIFIVILSQRYGPSLKDAGYDDISATHLEYREAIKEKKKLYMYVRNRLEIEYSFWKKNPKGKLAWVPKGHEKIFELLSEHRKLIKADRKSNWVGAFEDSTELKEIISKDLKAISGKATLLKLTREGNLPLLLIHDATCNYNHKTGKVGVHVTIINAGKAPAIQPGIWVKGTSIDYNIPTLLPNSIDSSHFILEVINGEVKKDSFSVQVGCIYSTAEGHVIEDQTLLRLVLKPPLFETISNIILAFHSRKYINSNGIDFS